MSLTVPARAKINLHLKVLFPRPDGYHEIRTIFQTVALADTIHLRPRPDGRIRFACDRPTAPADDSNLCVQAARLLQARAGCGLGVDIRLEKRIPVGGGMGGGSADAAMILAGLNALWDLRRPLADLLDWGATLGSDVPFFLLGGTAAGFGRGEEVIPLPDPPLKHVLLVCPPIAVSTAWAYARLNLLLTNRGWNVKIPSLHRAFFAGEVFLQQAENDFETVVFPEFPLLPTIKKCLLEAGAGTAMLSGSGSTVFGLFDTETACRDAAERLRSAAIPGEMICTRFIPAEEYRREIPFLESTFCWGVVKR